jgi:hypothetical protein
MGISGIAAGGSERNIGWVYRGGNRQVFAAGNDSKTGDNQRAVKKARAGLAHPGSASVNLASRISLLH